MSAVGVDQLGTRVAALGPRFGGALCLDFANTVEPRGGVAAPDLSAIPDLRDDFNDPYDLLAWGYDQRIYTREETARLWQWITDDPTTAQAAWGRALRLRDAVYRLFARVSSRTQPEAEDLAEVQLTYAEAMAEALLEIGPSGPVFSWSEPDLRRILWQASISALDLLRSTPATKIKICPGPGRAGIPCGWLFVDTTKNRSRRWCSMSDCGNVTKSRRQNQRRRAERPRRSPD